MDKLRIIKISNKELTQELVGDIKEFPRYTTQILNLANQNAQGTRPQVVGQLSELINECPEKTYEGWKKWYLKSHPEAISNAVEKVEGMVNKLKEAIKLIDEKMIRDWVEDLVLEKTFIGLRFQEAILKKVAVLKGVAYKPSELNEESQGIDGYIGNTPISIKPVSYKTKNMLPEKINAKMIFYEKTKAGLDIDASAVL